MIPDTLYLSLPTEGWLSRVEADLLLRTAQATTGSILEVGCYCGRSTVLLASLDRPLYAVDPFAGFNEDDPTGEGVLKRLLLNLSDRKITNVNIYQQRIEDWPPTPCGFCYLDGDHTYLGTRRQITKALACRPQAVAVHDVNDQGDGLRIRDACLELLGKWDEREDRLAVWRNPRLH